MPREFFTASGPRAGLGFQVGDVVPAEFLNHLDDLVYSYSDSILPTHTPTQVYLQATTGDEAQIVIDRRYFVNDFDVLAPVSGPAGNYHMYGVASYVPTSHATQVKPFDVVVSTAPPEGYQYVRHLGVVEWTGIQIKTVRQNAHRLNAAQLDGYTASQEPVGSVVPVASSNSKLAFKFRPRFPGVDAELGEVIDYWRPPGTPLTIPPAWAVCDGSIIPSGSHDLGPFPLQLPDLRDRVIYGATPSTTYGAAAVANNLSSGAPGIGGAKTSFLPDAALSHTHTTPNHNHVATHRHSILGAPNTPGGLVHHHDMAQHTHSYDTADWYRVNIGTSKNIVLGPPDGPTDQTGGFGGGAGAKLPVVKSADNNPIQSPQPQNTSYANPSTTYVQPSLNPVSPTVESRPRFYGFVRIMKVRD